MKNCCSKLYTVKKKSFQPWLIKRFEMYHFEYNKNQFNQRVTKSQSSWYNKPITFNKLHCIEKLNLSLEFFLWVSLFCLFIFRFMLEIVNKSTSKKYFLNFFVNPPPLWKKYQTFLFILVTAYINHCKHCNICCQLSKKKRKKTKNMPTHTRVNVCHCCICSYSSYFKTFI